MSLETFVSVDIHQAMAAINQVTNAMKPLRQPISIPVTVDSARAVTAIDNLKNRVQQVKTLAGESIKVRIDVSNVKGQADHAIRLLRSLQKSSAAIKVQANVSEALTKLQQVLDIIREIKASSKIQINVTLNKDASQMLSDIHKRLSQLNGAGVNWSATQKQMSADGGHWASGLQGIYGKLTMVGRAITSLAVVVRTLQGAYHFLFDFSNTLAQTRVGLITLFDGSQAKADKLLNTLKQYAIPTPFAMKDLAPLTQQALAFGLLDKNSKTLSKDLTSLFNDVGNAAYGLGRGKEGIDRIMLAFGQMKTATRVMGQDMLQLQNVGVNAWKYLAEATGKSTAEVRKLVEQGLIPADEAITAIRAGMAHDFGGGMARGAKTLEGALANLSDTLDVLKDSALKDTFDGITDALNNLVAITGTNAFEQWITGVVGKFKTGFAFIKGAIEGLVDIVKSMAPVIIASLALIGAKFLWMGGVAIVQSMDKAIAAIKAFKLTMYAEVAIIILIVAAFVAAYKNNIGGFRDMTNNAVVGAIYAFKQLAHAIAWVTGQVAAGVRKLFDWLQKIPDSVLSAMGPAGQALVTAKQFGKSISSALNFDNLEVRTDAFFNGIYANLQKHKDIGGVITDAFKPVSDYINNQLGKLNPLSGFGDMLKRAQAEAAKAASSYTKGKGPVPGSIPLGAGDEDTKNLKKNLDAAAKYWDNYAKTVESSAQRQIDAIKGVADSITGMVDGLKKDLIKNGVLNDPLQPAVAKLMRDMGLRNQAMQVAQGAAGQLAYAGAQSQQYRSQADQLKSTSGAISQATGLAAEISQSAVVMQARGATRDFAHMCQKLARVTVQKVTHQFDKFWAGSAAETMKNFQRAGIGFAAGKNYNPQPGDIVYTDGSVGKGYGHVQVVGPRGNYNDQYGSHANPTTRAQWIVRPGGSAPAAAMANAQQGAAQTNVAVQAIQNLLQSASNVPVRGSNVYAVPQQWMWAGGGKGVTDAPGSQARFKFQQWLTTQQGHDWDMILERSKQISLAIKQWNFDSAKKSLETFNEAMADTTLDSEKVAAIIKSNNDAFMNGSLAWKGVLDQGKIDQLLHKGNIGDINKLLELAGKSVEDFAKNFNEQIARLQHSEDPLYDTPFRVRQWCSSPRAEVVNNANLYRQNQ